MFRKTSLVMLIVVLFTLLFAGCNPSGVDPNYVYQQSTVTSEQLQMPSKGELVAEMNTNMGMIKIKFFPQYAPKAVENFITHAKKEGYYNGLKFHRVMNDFMIQGGDPKGTGTGGVSIWGKPFKDEFSPNLHNYRGALSMANSGPNTNGSQFFIVQAKSAANLSSATTQDIADNYKKLGGTPWLDNVHTVFGEVYEGMDVVDKIAAVEVNSRTSAPNNDVIIKSIKIVAYQ